MNRKKTVLILGAGVMQLPAIETAKGMGWKVIVADGNSEAAGASKADVFEEIDLKNLDGLLAMAGGYKARGGLDGVFTAGTDFSASVAYIAEKLGLPGIPYEAALNATDKARMRQVLSAAGVPCPGFFAIEKGDLSGIADRRWTFPLVVKPVDNMGARGVTRVDDGAALLATVEKALKLSRSGKAIVEEFVDGKEFSIDALVYDGNITICGIADRHIYFPPAFVELGHTMPSDAEAAVLEEIADVFKRGVRALGITRGAAKGDVFYSSEGPMIGEIAARLSGGYMSGWTFPYSSGVRLTEGGLNIALGLPPGDLVPKVKKTAAERAFLSIPGVIEEIQGFDEIEKIEGVKEFFPRVAVGAKVKFPENNVEKCGNVIAVHEVREKAIAAAEEAVSKVFLRLRPREPETASFLFGRDRIPHLAYLPNDETSEKFKTWPLFETEKRADDLIWGRLRIRKLPGLNEGHKDWNRKSVSESLAFLERRCRGSEPPGWLSAAVLAGVFWEAFLRGGSQGGAWAIDSLAEAGGMAEAREMVRVWCASD